MELKINEIQIPERITFNFEELKTELTKKLETYEGLVYTDDQIPEAKSDLASLRKLKDALNSERIRRKKEYLKPFTEFEAQVNEIIGIIDKPIQLIDKQVKEYAELKKQAKAEMIDGLLKEAGFSEDVINPEVVFEPRWLNASVSMKAIQAEIAIKKMQMEQDRHILDQLEEFQFEAKLVYKDSFDLRKALQEVERLKGIAKLKAEAQKVPADVATVTDFEIETLPEETILVALEKPAEAQESAPAGRWVNFSAYLTTESAISLKRFFEINKIQYKAI